MLNEISNISKVFGILKITKKHINSKDIKIDFTNVPSVEIDHIEKTNKTIVFLKLLSIWKSFKKIAAIKSDNPR